MSPLFAINQGSNAPNCCGEQVNWQDGMGCGPIGLSCMCPIFTPNSAAARLGDKSAGTITSCTQAAAPYTGGLPMHKFTWERANADGMRPIATFRKTCPDLEFTDQWYVEPLRPGVGIG